MANVPFSILRAASVAIDVVEVTCNYPVNPSLTADNFTIFPAYGIGNLPIRSVTVPEDRENIYIGSVKSFMKKGRKH